MAGFLVHRGFAKQHNLHLLTPTHEDMAWLANCKGCSSQPIDLCKKTTEAATHPPHPPTLILDVCQSVESVFSIGKAMWCINPSAAAPKFKNGSTLQY